MAFKKEIVEIIEPRDVFVGPDTAPVTLMEFGEYENEDCAKAHEVVKKIMEEFKGKIRFNFRHFPLTKIHQRSLKAGEASVAAAQEGKFWEMHNILFHNRHNLGTTSLKLHSREAGISNKKVPRSPGKCHLWLAGTGRFERRHSEGCNHRSCFLYQWGNVYR